MLNLEHETTPSWWAEVLARDCHIWICGLIHVVADLFKAVKITHTTFNQHFNSCIFSTGLRSCSSSINENDLSEFNKCNNKSTKGNRSHMVKIGKLESLSYFGLTILSSIAWIEIVSSCTDLNHKLSGILNPWNDPAGPKNHVPEWVVINFAVKIKCFSLGNLWVNFDFIHRNDTSESSKPYNKEDQGHKEIENWYCNDSFGLPQEVCGSINDVNSQLQWFETNDDAAQKAEGEDAQDDESNHHPHLITIKLCLHI